MADMEVLAPGGHQHLVGKIKEQLDLKADASLASAVEKVIENQPTAVLGGDLLTASDAYAAPPVALTVDGKSTQDGTPTSDAPVPIESVEGVELVMAGKNILPNDAVDHYTIGPSGERIKSDQYTRIASANIACQPSTSYVLSSEQRLAFVSIGMFDIDGTFIERASKNVPGGSATLLKFTTPSDAAYLIVTAQPKNTDSTPIANAFGVWTCQLERGSTATAYEPYASTTAPLYDGTLRSLPNGTKDTLSLTYLRPSTREGWAWYSPTLTQAVDTLDLGSQSWSRISSNSMILQTGRISTMPNVSGKTAVMCDVYAAQNSASELSDKHIKAQNNYNRIWVRDDAYNELTPADFKASLNGIYALYPRATPVITTLDPIELPVLPAPDATVWCDPSTGLRMRYVRDMQIVIDSLNSEIERAYAAIAPVESTTAKSNHAVGDYLMLGGTLCKVTSAIASGETIAIGTNVVATTVDAELASLA